MSRTISKLYFGTISPWERNFPADSKYMKYNREYSELCRQIEAALPQEQCGLVDKLCDAASKMSAETESVRFADGFRLGVRLASECFVDGSE